MQFLNRIPIWGWFLFTFTLVYATWNPTGYSLYQYLFFSGWGYPGRALVGIAVLGIYVIYAHETYLTFNVLGLIIFLALVAACLWFAADLGIIRAGSAGVWQWLTPGIFAFLLTLGLQGGRIYRNATGRVPVSVDSHHDAQPTHHS